MIKEIRLNSRYGDKNFLILNEDGKSYSLKAEFNYRVIFNGSKETGDIKVEAVDPSGGPYLCEGTPVTPNLVVDRFENNNELTDIKIFLKSV